MLQDFFFLWAGFLVNRKATAVKAQCPSPKQSVKIQTVLASKGGGGGGGGKSTSTLTN